MNRQGNSFVVESSIGRHTDYDYCGSIAQALRRRAERVASGDYRAVAVRRMRVTKTRRRGSQRFRYVGEPVIHGRVSAAAELPKAA